MADAVPEESHADRFHGFLRTWGLAEVYLDLCIAHIYGDHNGRDIDNQTPVTLERKLTFLKVAMTTQGTLAAFAPSALEAHRLLTSERQLRNIVVHAAPLKQERNGTVHFVRIEPNFDSPRYELRVVRPKDWDRLYDVAAMAGIYLQLTAFGLSRHGGYTGLDLSEEARREWFMKGAASFPGSKALRKLLQELGARRS